MGQLSSKELRILISSVNSLFSKRSILVPKTISELPADRTLIRELRLTDRTAVYLTDQGLDAFKKVVELIDGRDFFDEKVAFPDIWSAWKKVFEGWLSQRVQPESADEILNAIADQLRPEIRMHRFLVPLLGITLKDTSRMTIGAFEVVKSPIDFLDASGVSYDLEKGRPPVESRWSGCWLSGATHGTFKVARRVFSEDATLIVGVIAVAAAATYQDGATSFRLGIVMTPEDLPGSSIWMSWDETDRSLTTHYGFPRGQQFAVDTELSNDSDLVKVLERAFAMISNKDQNSEIQAAIKIAIYWFSDAHRDTVAVMSIVKYWSCVEAFFSLDREEITRSVASGLASILVFGGFRFVEVSEYKSIRKQIGDLYDVRSQAVHRGTHHHVTERHVAQFSQWVAWMVLEIVALSNQGYTQLSELKAEVERIDKMMSEMVRNRSDGTGET